MRQKVFCYAKRVADAPVPAAPWSEAKVSALTEHSTDIISLLDAQGRLLYNSPATERINGFKPEELVGVDTFDFIHPDDRAAVAKSFEAVLASPGSVHTVQYRYRTKAGGWLWMEAVASNQLHNPDVRGIVANTRDISERRRIDDERAKLEEQLRSARQLESLGTLAGGVAHDFNNLLSVLLGEASLLSENGAPEVREAAAHIEAAARRAADLTQLLLACAGRSRFTRAPLSLAALATEYEPVLRSSVRSGTRLTVSVDPHAPLIEAAEERLRQVLLSLVLNAADAVSAAGEVQVRVGHAVLDAPALDHCVLREGLAPGPAVFIEVSDDGHGMTAETVQRMFEPYFTTRQLGRGLGLAAVAGIVRGFRGAMSVRSTLGRGTTVTVWFASSSTALALGVPQRAEWRGQGLVLVVDDEPQTARVAARLLQSLGFETVTASDGLDALERFGPALGTLRLVLLDVVMPRLDGPTTFERLRELRPDLPVVFYSGYEAGAAEKALRAPGTAFLQKPFDRAALAACLRSILEAPVAQAAP